MVSPFETRFAASVSPALLRQFGDAEIVQQRKVDDFGTDYPVTGIWMPDPPEFERQVGQKLVLTGRLTVEVDADVPLLETDQWVIDETTWQVDKNRGALGTPQFGLQTIYLRRVDTLFTKSGREVK